MPKVSAMISVIWGMKGRSLGFWATIVISVLDTLYPASPIILFVSFSRKTERTEAYSSERRRRERCYGISQETICWYPMHLYRDNRHFPGISRALRFWDCCFAWTNSFLLRLFRTICVSPGSNGVSNTRNYKPWSTVSYSCRQRPDRMHSWSRRPKAVTAPLILLRSRFFRWSNWWLFWFDRAVNMTLKYDSYAVKGWNS